jgi:hypothetical protein
LEQELAYAVAYLKPVVVVILEQEAMDLLTRPSGATEAWTELASFEGESH